MVAQDGMVAAGTRVRVRRAEGDATDVAIEQLVAGAEVIGNDGARHTVRGVARLRGDAMSREVLLRAGALAPGAPAADLRVAPETLVAVGLLDRPEGLVPAAALGNGASIVNQDASAAGWFRVDLGESAVFLANGAPIAAAGEGSAGGIPLLSPGDTLLRLRRAIARRGGEAAPAVAGPAITVIAGGQKVAMEETEPGRFVCDLPPRSGPVRIGAPKRRPPDQNDGRQLGVCVLSAELDGKVLAFDASAFGPGFHPAESNAGQTWRWTNGDAWLVLPYSAAARRLVLRINDWHESLPLA